MHLHVFSKDSNESMNVGDDRVTIGSNLSDLTRANLITCGPDDIAALVVQLLNTKSPRYNQGISIIPALSNVSPVSWIEEVYKGGLN